MPPHAMGKVVSESSGASLGLWFPRSPPKGYIDEDRSGLSTGTAALIGALLLMHGQLGAGPGICARCPVVGFRLVLARLLSIATLRFASCQSHFAVTIGFCDGDIVGLVCGIVVEFNLLVID